MPRWLVPILLAVFLFFGLIASGPWALLGAVFLGIDALFVAWLSALAWPVLTPGSRLARVVVVVVLVVEVVSVVVVSLSIGVTDVQSTDPFFMFSPRRIDLGSPVRSPSQSKLMFLVPSCPPW